VCQTDRRTERHLATAESQHLAVKIISITSVTTVPTFMRLSRKRTILVVTWYIIIYVQGKYTGICRLFLQFRQWNRDAGRVHQFRFWLFFRFDSETKLKPVSVSTNRSRPESYDLRQVTDCVPGVLHWSITYAGPSVELSTEFLTGNGSKFCKSAHLRLALATQWRWWTMTSYDSVWR